MKHRLQKFLYPFVIIGVAIILLLIVTTKFQTIPSNSIKSIETEPIKIGAVLHLTGDQAEPAIAFRDGIELATHKINEAGGIQGRQLKLIIEDSQLKPKEALNAASKLINIDKVIVAIDASFLEVMANGPAFNTAKIPVITLWDSSEDIENLGDYIFAIGVWTPSAGEKAAQFTYGTLGAKTVVIVNTQNEWSQSVSKFFKEKFEALGGTVTETFSMAPSTNDYRTTITKTKWLNPDAIYSPVTDGVVQFYTQLHQLEFKKPIVTSDIITGEHINSSPEAFENIYQTQPLEPNSDATTVMIKQYEDYFKKDTKQVLFTAWGYDGLNILAEAIKKVGTDSVKLKNALYETKNYNGASGVISIDERGSSPKLENMFQIKEGSFTPID